MPTPQNRELSLREEFENKFVTVDKDGNKVVACPEDFDDKGGLSFWRDYVIYKFIVYHHNKVLSEIEEKLPRFDVYDGGEAEKEDGDYIRFDDLRSLLSDYKIKE